MKDIIAISGKSGCGNTTVSTLVAKELNFTIINYTFRQLAEKYEISFEDLLEKSKTNDKYDKELDIEQVRLTKQEKCVLGSRLAIWLLDDSVFKVYLYAGIEKRVKNIIKRENKIAQEVNIITKQRDNNDTERFKKLYGINNNEYSFANLIINIEPLTISEIVNQIIEGFLKWKLLNYQNQ